MGTKDKTLKPLRAGQTRVHDAHAAAPGTLVVTNKLGDFRRLYRWSAARGLEPVTPEMKMDVSGLVIDPARKHVYYTLNDGGYTRLRVLDAATLQPAAFPEMKDADHVYPGTPSRDGRYVTLGVETAKAPRTSYVYDWQTRTLTQWALPSAPEVDLTKFAVARLETYPARDGTKVPMFVRYPPRCAPEAPAGGEPCPVVVEFHGGPEGQAQPGFNPYAQLFVDAGFVYVEPNVRGSDGYGKAWLEADNGPKRLAVITDIEDAGKYAREHFARGGKAPKVAITGGSYGGYSTLVGMTMFAGTYDAGASIVGFSSLVTFLNNTAPYRRLLRITEYGDPEKDKDALVKLSPITYVDRVKAPLLLIRASTTARAAGRRWSEALAARGLDSSWSRRATAPLAAADGWYGRPHLHFLESSSSGRAVVTALAVALEHGRLIVGQASPESARLSSAGNCPRRTYAISGPRTPSTWDLFRYRESVRTPTCSDGLFVPTLDAARPSPTDRRFSVCWGHRPRLRRRQEDWFGHRVLRILAIAEARWTVRRAGPREPVPLPASSCWLRRLLRPPRLHAFFQARALPAASSIRRNGRTTSYAGSAW